MNNLKLRQRREHAGIASHPGTNACHPNNRKRLGFNKEWARQQAKVIIQQAKKETSTKVLVRLRAMLSVLFSRGR